MADKKISQLTNITGASLANDDEFPVVDTSANETKAVTREELFQNTPPINVTGTITSDGLTVDGNFTINEGTPTFNGSSGTCIVYSKGLSGFGAFYAVGSGTNPSYVFMGNATTGERVRLTASDSGQLVVDSNTLYIRRDRDTSAKTSILVETTGNISFYDSTGVSQGFRWNSATQRVGIGTTSPTTKVDVNGAVRTRATTVASLPSASTSGAGARHFVTDATSTTFTSVVTGGGSNAVPVYSDGTNWRIG